MKFLIAFVTVSFLLLSCGSKESGGHNNLPAPVPQGETNLVKNKGLLGRWGTLVFPMSEEDSGLQTGELKFSIIITNGFFTTHLENVTYGAKCAELELTVPANLNDDSVEVLEEKSIKKNFENNGLKCSISTKITKGTFKYNLDGDSLTIENPNSGGNLNFNRL